jgi:hypothetical protein
MQWRSPKVLVPMGVIALLLVSGAIVFGVRQRNPSPGSGNTNRDAISATVAPSMSPYVPTTDVASWTTYTSSALGISLKMPPQWYPHEVEEPNGHTLFISAPIDTADYQAPHDGQRLAVSVWREDNTHSQSIEDWAVDTLLNPAGSGPAERAYLDVGGTPALQLTFSDDPVSVTAINHETYRYVIQVSSLVGTYTPYQAVIDQFVTNLKFLP